MCAGVRVCEGMLVERKELSAVISVPARILHGAKQIISSYAARVISSKQTTLLWTGERLGAFPVNLSLPSTISSICGFVSVCLEYHEKYCKYRTVRLISVKAFVYQTFINLLYNKANVILLKENL